MQNYVARRIHFIILVSQSKQAIFSLHRPGYSRIPSEVILCKTRIGTREVGWVGDSDYKKLEVTHRAWSRETRVRSKHPDWEKLLLRVVDDEWESTRILDLDTVWLVKKDQVKLGSDLKPAIFQLHDGEQVNEPLQSPSVLIYWT